MELINIEHQLLFQTLQQTIFFNGLEKNEEETVAKKFKNEEQIYQSCFLQCDAQLHLERHTH